MPSAARPCSDARRRPSIPTGERGSRSPSGYGTRHGRPGVTSRPPSTCGGRRSGFAGDGPHPSLRMLAAARAIIAAVEEAERRIQQNPTTYPTSRVASGRHHGAHGPAEPRRHGLKRRPDPRGSGERPVAHARGCRESHDRPAAALGRRTRGPRRDRVGSGWRALRTTGGAGVQGGDRVPRRGSRPIQVLSTGRTGREEENCVGEELEEVKAQLADARAANTTGRLRRRATRVVGPRSALIVLRPLAHQKVTGVKDHPLRLLRFGPDRPEVRGRTLRGLW